MMTALHLNAALAALGPIMAQAAMAGDGLGVLLLEGVSEQIRASMERLPAVDEDDDFSDLYEPAASAGIAASAI